MNRFFSLASVVLLTAMTQQCTDPVPVASTATPDSVFTPVTLSPAFNDYWYQGKAELCTYDVEQERYGEMRQAEQVMVFVTEDFSASRQVKLDNAGAAGADKVPVLKLNALRRFETGIYDYSLMQSVFTPVSGMPTLKATTSVQDWCGQVFMQTNLEKTGYKTRTFSYFESEGDQEVSLPVVRLEDDIWTRLRLDPFSLQTGNASMLPSAVYLRLRHQPVKAEQVTIGVDKQPVESLLTIQYQSISRKVQIRFETSFPHKILGWEESVDGKLVSKGTLKANRNSAYWSEHDNIHAPLRDSLLLGHRN